MHRSTQTEMCRERKWLSLNMPIKYLPSLMDIIGAIETGLSVLIA